LSHYFDLVKIVLIISIVGFIDFNCVSFSSSDAHRSLKNNSRNQEITKTYVFSHFINSLSMWLILNTLILFIPGHNVINACILSTWSTRWSRRYHNDCSTGMYLAVWDRTNRNHDQHFHRVKHLSAIANRKPYLTWHAHTVDYITIS